MIKMHPRSKTSNSVSLDRPYFSSFKKRGQVSANERNNHQSQIDYRSRSNYSLSTRTFLQWMFLFLIVVPVPCIGQVRGRGRGSSFPAPRYFLEIGSHSNLHAGNYRESDQAFRRLLTGARKEGTQRWLDSAVYSVMRGEIAYQQGRYLDALGFYDSAADLFIFHSTRDPWTLRVRNWNPQPPQIDQSATRRIQALPWGRSGRLTKFGRFPTYQLTFGRDQRIPNDRGGFTIIPGTTENSVNVFEIMDAMALMIYRRDQILGPLSKINSRSRIIRNTLSDGANIANAPIPLALHKILYGISIAGEGEFQKSTEVLSGLLSLTENGNVGVIRDHIMTPIALLQMGRNAYEKGEFKAARNFYLEASYSAAAFRRYIVWQEAMIGAAKSHNALEPQVPMPWLQKAAQWGNRENVRVSSLSFALLQAENGLENGNIKQAKLALAQISKNIRRTDLKRSAFAARFQLVSNAVALVSGQSDDYVTFRKNLDLFRSSSLHLFRVKFINDNRTNRQLATATIEDQLGKMLDDPEEIDWKRDPFESLAIITGDRTTRLHQLVLSSLKTRDFVSTIENSEKVRRRTFLSALPLGGRLSSIRDLFGKSRSELSGSQLKRQGDLQGRFPALNDLLETSSRMEQDLRSKPLVPDFADSKQWKKTMTNWIQNNHRIERLMVNLGLKREFVPITFPEKPNMDNIQNRIPQESIVLYIQQIGQIFHVFLVTKEVVAYQNGINARLLNKELRKLAKAWQLRSYTGKIKATSLVDDKWKAPAHDLLKLLVPKATEEFWNNYNELVVVPDGDFWYLPFETLPLTDDPDSPLVTDKLAVRYAPMLGIAFSNPEPRRVERMALYPGLIYPKDEDELVEDGILKVEQAFPSVESITNSEFLPHQLTALSDGMIYWNYFKQRRWPSSVVPQVKKKSDLYKFLSLPHWNLWPNNGPKLMVVGGGTTALAEGFSNNKTRGNELFFFSTLLFSGGCDSIVLSRWQVGGHSSYDAQVQLAKELAKELPTAEAVKNTIKVMRDVDINMVKHPRITRSKKVPTLNSNNPLFWASMMTIDRGRWYPPKEKPEEKAVIPGLGQPVGGSGNTNQNSSDSGSGKESGGGVNKGNASGGSSDQGNKNTSSGSTKKGNEVP